MLIQMLVQLKIMCLTKQLQRWSLF